MIPRSPDEVRPPSVELATVTNVRPREWTLDVITEFTHRNMVYVPFCAPYISARGSGNYVMPQVGSKCYVLIPGDSSEPFVLGFVTDATSFAEGSDDITLDESGPSYRGGRPRARPGDMFMTTDDDNFVIVRRGGVVQIGSSSLAQTVYIPLENIIRTFFQKYHAISPLGEINWSHAVVDNSVDDDDETSVIISYSFRELVQDENFSVEIKVGQLVNSVLEDEGDHHRMASKKESSKVDLEEDIGLLSIAVNPNGEGVKYIFQLDKSGNNFVRSEGSMHLECVGHYFLQAADGVTIQVSDDGYLNIDRDNRLKAKVRSFVADALEELTLKASRVLADSSNVELGNGGKLAVIVDRGLSGWLASHTHPDPVSGTTGAPVQPLPNIQSVNVKAS